MMIENQFDNPLDLIHVPEFDNGQSLAGDSDTQNEYQDVHMNNGFSSINKI